MIRADIAVIGAGMAGASIAAELAPHAGVVLLEAEDQPGYHSTGRSAAFWSETYGGPLVQPLTTASGPFLRNPPRTFSERPFLSARGGLHISTSRGLPALRDFEAQFAGSGLRLQEIGRANLEGMVPGLRPGWNVALCEPGCSDIDVAALHAAYLREARRNGAELHTGQRVKRLERSTTAWILETDSSRFEAGTVVNGAGAWASDIAALAGALPIPIQPFRRTIVQLKVAPAAPSDLPLVLDALGRFYFKPERGRLWLSPHDETPCDPSDCAAEEEDVALAIHRLQQVVDWRIERVEHKWAGLRSFAPDRLPVYGFDPLGPRFFWFAGQGGFGIQTAPAAAKLAAAMILDQAPDPMVAGIEPRPYAPRRFAN